MVGTKCTQRRELKLEEIASTEETAIEPMDDDSYAKPWRSGIPCGYLNHSGQNLIFPKFCTAAF